MNVVVGLGSLSCVVQLLVARFALSVVLSRNIGFWSSRKCSTTGPTFRIGSTVEENRKDLLVGYGRSWS